MRIVSWNINSLRKRQDRLFEWLEATKPDIVCLQETKCTGRAISGAGAASGRILRGLFMARNRITASRFFRKRSRGCAASLCDEVDDAQARVIAATIGDVRVFSIYAPNGQAVGSPAYEYKLQWYARLRNCLEKEYASSGCHCRRRFQRRARRRGCARSRLMARRDHVFGGGASRAFQAIVRERA